jgi:hypothetical protein
MSGFALIIYMGGVFLSLPNKEISIWDRIAWPMLLGAALFAWALEKQKKGGWK